MAKGSLNVFRELTNTSSRLGFHTSESSDKIPETAGCYAWMLPLWVYDENLEQFLDVVSKVLNHEPNPIVDAKARFSWEDVLLRVSKLPRTKPTQTKIDTWEKIREGSKSWWFLQQNLLEASLFLPPLYVGMTDNLKRRYLEHTEGRIGDGDHFKKRWTQFVKKIRLKVEVHDLLFVSITTLSDSPLEGRVTNEEYNRLFEQIMIRLCLPSFSEK